MLNQCRCSTCSDSGQSDIKDLHGLLNFFLASLNEDQKMLFVGLECKRRGSDDSRALAQIFGWDEKAIVVAKRRIETEAGLPIIVDSTIQDQDDHVQAKMAKAKPISFKSVM
jgi:hypothetical protein